MIFISGLLSVFIFGFLLSVIIIPKMHILERLGTSFLLGFGVFTLLMFCYSTLGIRITVQSTLVALGTGNALAFAVFRLLKRKIKFDYSKSGGEISRRRSC